MSATPVINNLYEAKALLEMTRGEQFDELKTFSTIANALAMHEKLMLYGIRYRPNYKIDRISNLNSTNSRTNQR